MKTQRRQGDVFFQPIAELPKGLKPQLNLVLVYGESTGHGHRLSKGKVFTSKDGAMYLNLSTPAQITHEEHNTINLEKGFWAVLRQREYLSKDMVRIVVD